MAVPELNIDRCAKLVERAIRDFELDLDGLSVLTEAASGPFVFTPLVAALAGARTVRALTRDSHYGSALEVTTLTNELAARWGVADRVEVLVSRDDPGIGESDVVTNLGFVRPLDRSFLERLGGSSAVALMFEPWEHRDADIDLAACRELDIPVLGTNEDDPRLRTFGYLPGIAAKLLLELGIEVFGSRVLLVSGGRFAAEIMKKSIGIEKRVLVREAMPALPPRAAASGIGSPPPATCSAFLMTTCCAGQITNQTLYHMSVPIRPPVRILVM